MKTGNSETDFFVNSEATEPDISSVSALFAERKTNFRERNLTTFENNNLCPKLYTMVHPSEETVSNLMGNSIGL